MSYEKTPPQPLRDVYSVRSEEMPHIMPRLESMVDCSV